MKNYIKVGVTSIVAVVIVIVAFIYGYSKADANYICNYNKPFAESIQEMLECPAWKDYYGESLYNKILKDYE